MLVDFEVENFRSYRENKRFSLVASSAKEPRPVGSNLRAERLRKK
jgi:AAA15 family ATPase/GTPase